MSAMTESATKTEKRPKETTSAVGSRSVSPNGHGRESDVEAEPTGPPKTVIREYFESAVVTVIMALFGMTFIVQAVKVPTGSMQNTITVGDHLLVNKFIFAPGPRLPILRRRARVRNPGPALTFISQSTASPQRSPRILIS